MLEMSPMTLYKYDISNCCFENVSWHTAIACLHFDGKPLVSLVSCRPLQATVLMTPYATL